jgi:mannose-6-phosphate isomerase
VWGGRELGERYGKPLPEGAVGESWELVDREDDQTVFTDGSTLQELWADERILFGTSAIGHPSKRFPLLIKLLDARDTLSVQVHPPAEVADALGGEPKTEAWYLADAAPGAFLYAGLRPGVDRAAFDAALDEREVESLLHRIDVSAGDALLLPSGRVHAIGAGCLVVEVQQSSDTTYRVWDFDRPGTDGEPRALHVDEALRSIDFDDHEPPLTPLPIETGHFRITRHAVDGEWRASSPERCGVVVVLDGEVEGAGPGETLFVPATHDLPLAGSGTVLHVELP